jgi:L-lactate dehydrogenase complex protein LldG
MPAAMSEENSDNTANTFAAQYRALAGFAHIVATEDEAGAKILEILRDAGVSKVVVSALPSVAADPIRHALQEAEIVWDAGPFLASELPERIDGAPVGITGAVFAIAQSGTLVEIATDDAVRLVSSLPRTHIGVVYAKDIVPRFEDAAPILRELFATHDAGCAITFISGPSRTGDIELKLTLGVHGPEVAHAVVITG